MKTIFNIKSVLVAIIILTISTGFSHQGNETRNYDDLVQVVANSAKGTARINWSDNRIEMIEISSSNGQYMPTIPVMGATELHLNDLIDGTYTITFKSNETILYSKTIEISR
jgi:hypothetical protein